MTGMDDPFCRGAFPWNNENQWDTDLLDFYKAAIALRRQHGLPENWRIQYYLYG